MLRGVRWLGLVGMLLASNVTLAQEAANVSRISVTGRGEVAAIPDSAVLTFAVLARHENAAEAQAQVNRALSRAMAAVRKLGIPAEQLTTTGITLTPVYADRRAEPAAQARIIAYHASNRIEVRLQGTEQVGAVIDAVVKAGANGIDGIAFTLSDDAAQRQEALRQAVLDARAKADAIAAAMGVRLESLEHVVEQGVGVFAPSLSRAMVAEAAATPVSPGQVRVEANVQVVYRIAQGL